MSGRGEFRNVRDLYSQATVWAIRGLLLFGMWALSEIYSNIITRLDETEQRTNGMAASLARVEVILIERNERFNRIESLLRERSR